MAVAAAACSPGGGPGGELPAPPGPEEIPALEAALARNPGDVDLALLLGTAYRDALRPDDARAVLAPLLEADPAHPELSVLMGVVEEDAERWSAAANHYRTYLATGPEGALAEEVRTRLDTVDRAALQADIREALAAEAALTGAPPDPATVGVFPFVYDGADPQWRPLSRALAELLITDLGVTGRLRVLERVRVQALLDELALAGSGLVDPATAPRSGRLLGSGRVVQGRIAVDGAQRISVDAAVVRTDGQDVAEVRPVDGTAPMQELFDLETRLALDLHAAMGIQLTPAERDAIEERATDNVQALLAFGRGLEALDAGRWADAQQHFDEATGLDPSFALAASRGSVARRAVQGADVRSRIQARAAMSARRRQAVQALRTSPAAVRNRILRRLDPRKRAVLAEVLGQDRIGTAILLELVFRVPGDGR